MKILVMSDTHGDEEIIRHVREANLNVDAIFHCGDSELSPDNESLEDVHVVQGNCDWRDSFLEEKLIELSGVRIFITHGQLYDVKRALMPIKYKAEEMNADVVLFGHSHLLGAETDQGVLFLNPGSLKQPRGRREKSYAILQKIAEGWHIQFYSDEQILLEETFL